MADGPNQINIELDAQAVDQSASQTASQIAQIVSSAASAEQKVKALFDMITSLKTVMDGADSPAIFGTLQRMGQALSGSFSEAGMKLKALQGELQEFRASSINVTNEILNAQAKAYASLNKAVNESRVQTFQRNGNAGAQAETDAAALRARMEAERRTINTAVSAGGAAPQESVDRLRQMEQQLKLVEAARSRDSAAMMQEIKLQEQLDKLQAQYSLQRTAGDTAGKFQTLTKIADNRSNAAFTQNGFQTGENTDAAMKRAADLNKAFDQYTAKQKAAATEQAADAAYYVKTQENSARAEAQIGEIERQRIVINQALLDLKKATQEAQGVETVGVQKTTAAYNEQLRTMERLKAEQAAQNTAQRQTPEALQANAAQSMAARSARFSLNGGADVFKMQTQILANYQVVNVALQTIRNAVEFVVQFQTSLKELQAVTDSTNGEMDNLSKKFIEVSQSSKFSAEAIAQAGVALGKAGFSSNDINQSVDAIVKLATATGTDLKQAVDLAAIAMNVFNFRASEMGGFANTVSAALNSSKLDADNFASALQYSGNIAAESKVSFTDLTTALALMSNAGIKSGTALGSGFRQILENLITPSKKFQTTVTELGLTFNDIDVQSQGFLGAMRNLSNAGYSAGDAMTDMGMRGGSALAAMLSQVPNIDRMSTSITMGGDAMKANATQMDSVAAQFQRFSSAAGALAVQLSGPLMKGIQEILSLAADLLTAMSAFSDVLQVVATAIGSLVVVKITQWLGSLVLGLVGVKSLTAGTALMSEEMRVAAVATEELGTAMSFLSKSNVILLGLSLAVTAVVEAFDLFGKKGDDIEAAMQKTQTAIDASKGRIEDYQKAIDVVGNEIDTLAAKHTRLSENANELSSVINDLNNRFRDMGFYMDQDGAKVDDLIVKLRGLQTEQLKAKGAEVALNNELLRNQLINAQAQVNQQFGAQGPKKLADSLGLSANFDFDKNGNATPKKSVQVGTGNDALGGDASSEIPIPESPAQKAIASSFNVLNQPAPTTPEDASALSQQIADKMAELNKAKTDLAHDLSADSTDAQKQIDTMISALRSQLKPVQNVQLLNNQLGGGKDTAASIAALQTDAGKVVTSLSQNLRSALDDINKQYKEKVADAATLTGRDHATAIDQAKRDQESEVENLLKTYQGTLSKTLKDAGADTAKALQQTPQFTDAQAALSAVKENRDNMEKALQAGDEIALQAHLRRLEAQISTASSAVSSKTPGATSAATITSLYNQAADTAVALNEMKRKQLPTDDPTRDPMDTADEIRATYMEKLQAALHRFATAGRSAADALNKAADGVDFAEFKAAIKAINDRFKQINDQAKSAIQAAELPVVFQQARIAGASQTLYGNNATISDVQKEQMSQKLEAAQEKELAAKIAGTKAQIEGTAVNIADTRSAIEEANARKAVLVAQVNAGAGNTPEITAMQARIKALDAEIATVTTTLVQKTDKQIADQDALAKLQAQQAGQYGAIAPDNLLTGITTAFNQFIIGLKTGIATLVDGFKQVLTTTSQAMSTFLQTIVMGTDNVRDAFRTLVTSILGSIAKALSDAIVNSLFKTGADLIMGSSFGSSIMKALGLGSGDTGTTAVQTAAITANTAALNANTVALGGKIPSLGDGLDGTGTDPSMTGDSNLGGGLGSSDVPGDGGGGGLLSGISSIFTDLANMLKQLFDSLSKMLSSVFSGLSGGGGGGGGLFDLFDGGGGGGGGGVLPPDDDRTPMNTRQIISPPAMNPSIISNAPRIQPQQQGPGAPVNVWVVAPSAPPQLGPKDIVMHIGQDILKGGQTKQLIKAVNAGTV